MLFPFVADFGELRSKTFALLKKCEGSRKLTETRRNDIRKALSSIEEIWSAHKPIVDNVPDGTIDSAMGRSTKCVSPGLIDYIVGGDDD